MSDFINGRRVMRENLDEQERIDELYTSKGLIPPSSRANNAAPSQTVTANEQQGQNAPVLNQTSTDNKCPSCGATLAFDPKTGGMICNFCGSSVAINAANAVPGRGYTFNEITNNAANRITNSSNKIITCGTCGGKFMADPSAISGLCPYCGSNSITVSGSAEGMLQPTGVIPFQVDKERAQRILKDWLSRRRFAPMDLTKNSEIMDLVGVYVPYWMFDCDTFTHYKGKFGKTVGSGDDQYTKYHKAEGNCELPVKDLTIVASSRLANDAYWKKVSKFNLDYMRNYDPNLLAGFWSESYSIDGQAAWQTAMGKIYNLIRGRIMRLEDADVIAKIDMQPEAVNIRAKYVLAPVWITSFNYSGGIFQVLINGQTGCVEGTWPKSFKRVFRTIGIVIGAIFGTLFLRALIMQFVSWITALGG